jgi:CRP-like cAMP-binding protein
LRVPLKFDAQTFLESAGIGRQRREYKRGEVVFSQGDPADAVFYVRRGLIELMVTSSRGRKAVIGVPGAGDFFGEGSSAGQTHFASTATATTDATIVGIDKQTMIETLRDEPALVQLFMSFLLSRHIELEADLADRMFTFEEGSRGRPLSCAPEGLRG